MRSIHSIKKKFLLGKSVLLRVDFNVEIEGGKILDDFRIRKSLPTIEWLRKSGAKILILSHLGRPSGEDIRYSLKPVAKYLEEILERKVVFFEDWRDDFGAFWKVMPPGTMGMLENLRFYKEEERNDSAFARKLSKLGDIYVNDAFSVSHRKNASVVAITKYLPSFCGFLMGAEISALNKIKKASKKPFVVVLGGKKLSDKLPVISAFIKKADFILTGGGIANTFIAAKGVSVGKSIFESDFLNRARKLIRLKGENLLIPVDWKTGSGGAIYDIGPKTIKEYIRVISKAKMILWNGPMGMFEDPKFKRGTYEIARAIFRNIKSFSVVGGGETVACFRKANPQYNIENRRLFLSTGGGAMLEYLAGKKLPGIEALKNKIRNSNIEIRNKCKCAI